MPTLTELTRNHSTLVYSQVLRIWDSLFAQVRCSPAAGSTSLCAVLPRLVRYSTAWQTCAAPVSVPLPLPLPLCVDWHSQPVCRLSLGADLVLPY